MTPRNSARCRNTELLDRLAWVLPVLTLLLYGVAVLLAFKRRKALLRVGVGITVAMVVSLIAYGFGRTSYLNHVPADQSTAAASAIFDTVTRFVERGIRALLAIGLIVWLIAWLAGPSRPAVAVRRQWDRLTGRAGDGLSGAVEIGPVNRWVVKNAMGLRVGLGVLLLLALFAWDHPTGMVVLLFAVVGLFGLGVIQILGAGGSSESEPGSRVGSTR